MPLVLAMYFGDFWLFNPFKHALKTFIGFDDPIDLDSAREKRNILCTNSSRYGSPGPGWRKDYCKKKRIPYKKGVETKGYYKKFKK